MQWMLNVKRSLFKDKNTILTTIIKRYYTFSNYQTRLNFIHITHRGRKIKTAKCNIKNNKRDFLDNKIQYNKIYINNLKKKIILHYKKLYDYDKTFENLKTKVMRFFLKNKINAFKIKLNKESYLTKKLKFIQATNFVRRYKPIFSYILELIKKKFHLIIS